jgi:DNA polymerase III epsilon subunit-like protein
LPPAQAFIEFEGFLSKHFGGIHFNNLIRLMGHNLPFDISFLQRLIKHAKISSRGYDWFKERFQRNYIDTLTEVVDTIEAFGLPYPSDEFPNLKLASCATFFGLEIPENTHSALVDARLTGELYTKLLRMKNPSYPEPPKQQDIKPEYLKWYEKRKPMGEKELEAWKALHPIKSELDK